MRSLKHSLDRITKPAFAKRGFAQSRIITDWEKIVGKGLAEASLPRKLSFPKEKTAGGTLYIEVYNSSFATEMVYLEPFILEKISCYFGYKAVSRIKIIQNLQYNNKSEPEEKEKIMSTENAQALESAVSCIEDEELRNALKQLGQGILAE